MWVLGQNNPHGDSTHYIATSEDGVVWTKHYDHNFLGLEFDGQSLDDTGELCVLRKGSKYMMWFGVPTAGHGEVGFMEFARNGTIIGRIDNIMLSPGDCIEVQMNWVPEYEGYCIVTVEVVDIVPSEVPPISRWYNNFAVRYVEVHEFP
jgi:hypothetical protein